MPRLDIANAALAGLDAAQEVLDVGPVLVGAAAGDGGGAVFLAVLLGDELESATVYIEGGVGAVELHAVARVAADAVVVALAHLVDLNERTFRAVEFVGHEQRVGRIAQVVDGELAAGGVD